MESRLQPEALLDSAKAVSVAVPADLAAEYFAQLKAPAKHLVWFGNSAHTPSAEEPELFNKMMIEQVLPLR